MTTCSLCIRLPEENEPALQPYALGPLSGDLCAVCATRIQVAVTRVVAEIMREVWAEEMAALEADEKARRRADVDKERERLRAKAAEELRLTRERERMLQEQRRAERDQQRVQAALNLAARFRSRGVANDVAVKRAAAAFGLRSDVLMGKAA